MKKYILILLLACSTIGNAQYNLFARQNFETKKSTFSYVLDVYPNAAIAYSFRKLRSAYTGYCVKVRRSSDNTTLDIGFVNNILDEASLIAFVGSGDGLIHTWYDQSGNSNNLTASSDAAQPRIVTTGVAEKESGKIAVYSTTAMRLSSGSITQTYDSAFTVCKITSTTGAMIPFSTASNSGSYFYAECASGSSGISYSNWGTPSVYKNGNATSLTNTRGSMYTAFVTGNSRFLLSEFSLATISAIGRSTQYAASSSINTQNYIQEHITYASNQTANKTGIENNINAFYSIY